MTQKLFFIAICFLFFKTISAQTADALLRKGNEFYKKRQYAEAEKEYAKALEKLPENKTAIYNLAIAKYRMNKPDDAKKEFKKLLTDKNEIQTKATAFYNTGAILSTEKKLEESIEAYKNALRLNAADNEARENLQKALLELKKQQQPPRKKEEQKKKKEEEKKQQKPQSKLSKKEVEKQLQLLQQKEKEVKERMQNEKMKEGTGNAKDW